MDRIEKLAREIREAKKLAFKAATQPRLPYSSIDEGALTVKDAGGEVRQTVGMQDDGSYASVVKDADGVVRQVIGEQSDGSYTAVDVNGPAPVSAPAAPSVVGQAGLLLITGYGTTTDGAPWPLDLAGLEVHVGLASGFTPSPATKVGEWGTSGGMLTLAMDPGTYFVVLVPRNTSGVTGTSSAQVSATVTPAATGANGKPSYSTPEEPTGLTAADDGAIWFDSNNGNAQSRWSGTLLDWVPVLAGPQALTVDALAGKVVPLENIMSMAWGVPDPTAAINIDISAGPVDVIRHPNYGQFFGYTGPTYTGLVRHEGGWWFRFRERTVSVGNGYLSASFYTPVQIADDGTMTDLGPEISNMQETDINGNNQPKFAGVTRVGTTWYVLRADYGALYADPYVFWIDRYDDTWTLLGTTSLGALSATAATGSYVINGTIGTDGTNVLTAFADANRKVVTQTRNPTTLAVTSTTTSTTPIPSGPNSTAAGTQSNGCSVYNVMRGSFDFGSSRTIATGYDMNYSTTGGQDWALSLDSGGVNQAGETWPNMGVYGNRLAWSNGLFWIGSAAVIQKFTSSKVSTDAWITYTWADTNPTDGTHESASAPATAITIPPRNYVQFHAPNMNVAESTNAPDTVRYYLAPRGGTAPALTDFKRLANVPSMSDPFFLTPRVSVLADFSGTATPPATTTFPAGDSGALVSDEGGFIVRGDGTGDWPYLRDRILNEVPAGAAIDHNHSLRNLEDTNFEYITVGDQIVMGADGLWKNQPPAATVQTKTAQMRSVGAQAIPNGAWTVIGLPTIAYETDTDMTDLSTNRIYITKAGKYRITANGSWSASTAGTRRLFQVFKNGIENDMRWEQPQSSANAAGGIVGEVDCVVGDYFDLRAWQNSGANLNTGHIPGGMQSMTVTEIAGSIGPQGDKGDPGDPGPTGSVANSFKGAWAAVVVYAVGDIVTYSGSSFIRKVAGASAGTPAADTTNWSPLALAGSDLTAGIWLRSDGTNQTFTHNVGAQVTLGEVARDDSNGSMHASGSTVVIDRDGFYAVTGSLRWDTTANAGRRNLSILSSLPVANYEVSTNEVLGTAAYAGMVCSAVVWLAAGSVLQLQAYQSSGANLQTRNEFTRASLGVARLSTGPKGDRGLTWRGPWAAETAYASGDAVSYNGGSYFRITGGTTATPPTGDSTNWGVLAAPASLTSTDTGWIPVNAAGGSGVVFQNGWTNYGGVFETAAYRILNGICYLRGLITGGTISASLPAFTLPAGARPSAQKMLAGVVSSFTSGPASASTAHTHAITGGGGVGARINVMADGRVCLETGATGVWYGISCSFPVDQ